MARFYGLLIVRDKAGNERAPLVIAQETVSIGGDPGCDIQIAGLQPRHLVLLCDLSDTGGISLVNTSSAPIVVEQRQKVEHRLPSGGGNGTGGAEPPRRRQVLSGAACPVNNETLIFLDGCELEVRLAPAVRDRPQEEDARADATFSLEVGRVLMPIEQAAGQPARPGQQPLATLVLKPGDERAIELKATSTASHGQDIFFHDIVVAPDAPLRLAASQPGAGARVPLQPAPPWVRLKERRMNLQTQVVDRATDYNAILLTPPRSPSSRAGSYTFQIEARSSLGLAKAGNPPRFQVTLLPYVDLQTTLRRRKITAWRQGMYGLEIQNSSNWPVPMILDLSNREDALTYDVAAIARDRPVQVDRQGDLPVFVVEPIAPGETVAMTIAARPRRRWPFGRSASYPFTLTASVDIADRGELLAQQAGSAAGYKHLLDLVVQNERSVAPVQIEAELVQRRLPYWLLLVLLVLLVLLAVLMLPAIPLTVADRVARYRPEPVAGGALRQAIVVDGQVVASRTVTLRSPLAGTLARISVPESCKPSLSAATSDACRLGAAGPVALIDADAQLAQLDETLRLLDKTSQTITGMEAQWRIADAKASADLEQARRELARVGPEGGESALRQAAEQVQTAQENLADVQDRLSQEKTAAEIARSKAATDLQKAQRELQEAKSNLAWVQKHDTHPTEQYMVGGQLVPRPLTTAEKQQFADVLANAERVVSDAEQVYNLSINAYEVAKEREVTQIQQASRALEEAREHSEAAARGGTAELLAAEGALGQAEVAAEAAGQQGDEQIAAALDTARSVFNQLRKDNPLLLGPPERLADGDLSRGLPLADLQQYVQKIDGAITTTQQLLFGAEPPPHAPGAEPKPQANGLADLPPEQAIGFRNSEFDKRRAAQQARKFQRIDAMLSTLEALRGLTALVQDSVKRLQRLAIPAGAHVVQLHARVGDQLAANAPLLTYYVDPPAPQVIAGVDPKQLGGLQPQAQVYSSTAALPITTTIVSLPALFDGDGRPQTISQTIVLSGPIALPLYTPVKVRLTRTILSDAPLIVPERAIVGEGADTAVIVRRPVVSAGDWLAVLVPSLGALQLDERLPVRVDARADGKAAVTLPRHDLLRAGDYVLVR